MPPEDDWFFGAEMRLEGQVRGMKLSAIGFCLKLLFIQDIFAPKARLKQDITTVRWFFVKITFFSEQFYAEPPPRINAPTFLGATHFQ